MTLLTRAGRRRLLPVHIADDRGDVRPYSPHNDSLAGASDPRLQAIRRQQMRDASVGRRWWWLTLLFPVLLLAAAAFRPPTIMLYMLGAVFGVGIAATSTFLLSRRLEGADREFRERWCNAALRRGVCAVCEYNLHGIEPEADGCIICPECGSAWHRVRIRSSGPAAPARPDRFWWVASQETLLATTLVDDTAAQRHAPCLRSLLRHALVLAERQPVLDAAVRGLRARGRALRMVLAVAMLAPAGIVMVGGFLAPAPPLTRAGMAMAPLFFAWLAYLILRSDIGVRRDRRASGLLAAGFCPACGGDMHGEASDERGLVMCPQCDARWRVSR